MTLTIRNDINTCSNLAFARTLDSNLLANPDGRFLASGRILTAEEVQGFASIIGLQTIIVNHCQRIDNQLHRKPAMALLLPNLEAPVQMDTTTVFAKNHKLENRIVVNQGGTRSSKTYSICQHFIIRLLAERDKGKVLTIARKTMPALKATVMRDFFEVLQSLGLYQPEHHSRADMTYNLFGNLVEFISMDDPQKKRGAKRNYLWMNEANEFALEDFRQLALRTAGQIFLDYNPSDEFHWIYDEVLTREDCSFVQSTYLDNPFLPEEIIGEIERLQQADLNYWKVFGLGERGSSQAAVYTHQQEVPNLPQGGETIYGLDFGFNNPAALVRVVIKDNAIYAEELLYKAGLTNADLIEQLRKLIPKGSRPTIYADAAEPQRIEEIFRAGFNIKPGNKDVRKGIDSIKARQFFITSASVNLIKESRCYKYKEDLHGNILEEPVKYNDHALDALRYAAHTYLLNPKFDYVANVFL